MCWLARRLRRPVKWIEDRLRALRVRRPGARAGPHHRDRASRPTARCSASATCSPTTSACTARWWRRSITDVHRARAVPDPEHPLRVTRGVHEPAAHRRGARRRPAAGRAGDGADDGPHGRDARHRPGRAARPQPDPRRTSSLRRRDVLPRRRAPDLRQRRLPGAAAAGAGAGRLRRRPARSRRGPRARAGYAASASRSASRASGLGPFEGAITRLDSRGQRGRDDRRAAPGPGATRPPSPRSRRTPLASLRGRRVVDRRHRGHSLRRRQLRRAGSPPTPGQPCVMAGTELRQKILEVGGAPARGRGRGPRDRGRHGAGARRARPVVALAQIAHLGNAGAPSAWSCPAACRRAGGVSLLHAVTRPGTRRAPCLRPGRGPGDRRGRDPALRRRPRLRQRDQPADRRGPDPGRRGPRAEQRALRGGRSTTSRARPGLSFLDYPLPSAREMPRIEMFHLPRRARSTRSASRAPARPGTLPVPAAIANAVEDALRPLGARVTRCR